METNKIIISLKETISKIQSAEEEYRLKKELLEKELEDKKSDILSQLGFRIGDKVTLHLFEHRDDRVHCFQVEQSAECYIHGVKFSNFTDDKFLAPVLRKKDRKKDIHFNQFLDWDLINDGKVVLSHRSEHYDFPKTYTEEQLRETRIRCLELQKI